jgi:hypothetical protein
MVGEQAMRCKLFCVILVATVLAAIPVVYYWSAAPLLYETDKEQREIAYQCARVLAASLSVLVTAFVAGAALVQYHQNSLDKRVERSMAFWKRTNGDEYIKHWEKFLAFWRRCDEGFKHDKTKLAQAFVALARDNGGADQKTKESIEQVLDFYDEACAAVTMGACDEDAMFYYLGPIMVRHWRVLSGFITSWTDEYDRPEKWHCFVSVAKDWAGPPADGQLPSGKPLRYPISPHAADSWTGDTPATPAHLNSKDLTTPS